MSGTETRTSHDKFALCIGHHLWWSCCVHHPFAKEFVMNNPFSGFGWAALAFFTGLGYLIGGQTGALAGALIILGLRLLAR
jgi:hypothetical protein